MKTATVALMAHLLANARDLTQAKKAFCCKQTNEISKCRASENTGMARGKSIKK